MDTDIIKQLQQARQSLHVQPLVSLFEQNPQRFNQFSRQFDDLLFDFSKVHFDQQVLDLLIQLADSADIESHRAAMFNGSLINFTEQRAVLHTALRQPVGQHLALDGVDGSVDVVEQAHQVLQQMMQFAEGVRSGQICASNDQPFTDVVSIGIGGSGLGPLMATTALRPFHDGPRLHFVANVDATDLNNVLNELNPQTTLFIIASKTFTTQETLINANSARQWLVSALGENAVGKHFAAISTALDKVAEFGIESCFAFWDWVGGRYSLWSAIGLPLMIAIGKEHFQDFLDGAHAMDKHFIETPLMDNLPVLFALIGVWHHNICNYRTRALIPYSQNLAKLPDYIQQLDMESNGKSVDRQGNKVAYQTAPVLWGEVATNAQHSFFQMLHQGTQIVPCEFLIAAKAPCPDHQHHHQVLVANCFAQSEALMSGRNEQQTRQELTTLNTTTNSNTTDQVAFRTFVGNRPSITMLYPELTPSMLGKIIALYEHRVFVEGIIWQINSFDQWGVELGKQLANKLLPAIENQQQNATGISQPLIEHYHQLS